MDEWVKVLECMVGNMVDDEDMSKKMKFCAQISTRRSEQKRHRHANHLKTRVKSHNCH